MRRNAIPPERYMRGKSWPGAMGSTSGRSSFGWGSGGFSTGYGLPGSSSGRFEGCTGSFAMLGNVSRRTTFRLQLSAADWSTHLSELRSVSVGSARSTDAT
jgi:hypothetical protein